MKKTRNFLQLIFCHVKYWVIIFLKPLIKNLIHCIFCFSFVFYLTFGFIFFLLIGFLLLNICNNELLLIRISAISRYLNLIQNHMLDNFLSFNYSLSHLKLQFVLFGPINFIISLLSNLLLEL